MYIEVTCNEVDSFDHPMSPGPILQSTQHQGGCAYRWDLQLTGAGLGSIPGRQSNRQLCLYVWLFCILLCVFCFALLNISSTWFTVHSLPLSQLHLSSHCQFKGLQTVNGQIQILIRPGVIRWIGLQMAKNWTPEHGLSPQDSPSYSGNCSNMSLQSMHNTCHCGSSSLPYFIWFRQLRMYPATLGNNPGFFQTHWLWKLHHVHT